MFTGIIEHCGIILAITQKGSSLHLKIESQFSDLVLGESIAVEGICLTVTEINNNIFSCDISPETLAVTIAGSFKKNQKVNLERALQLSSRLGGHMVAGHVDQVAKVKSICKNQDFLEMQFTDIHELNRSLITKKGSVTINGVSLTINDVISHDFSVMLIPHTLEHTTLSILQEQDGVNIEFDMFARIIVEQCRRYLK